ncbi:nucleotidyltransferase [Niallia sp. Krafla_26]|uniref:nucleotidyltransferase n=1 Tax=Niallia sp. Krafla_26 TaxID=3064703 RepID=UPI003D18168E
MNSIREAKQMLSELETKSTFEKMVKVSAILTKLLESKQIRPVIVGGLAVEIYTRSDYTTVDIDLIISDRKLAGEILEQLGFTVEGRHWYHEKLLVSIEIPNDMLEDADYRKVTELQIDSEMSVYVIGIEDIILDRLRACVHWKSTSDCEWGQRMFLLHYERLDLIYMKEMAKKDLTNELLDQWLLN